MGPICSDVCSIFSLPLQKPLNPLSSVFPLPLRVLGIAFALSERSGISTALAAASISLEPRRRMTIGRWLPIAW